MKNLVVMFPGAGYGLDSPLLYYADFLFETKGYERFRMNYQDILSRLELPAVKRIELLREYVWKQVKDVDFNKYEEIVFLSKSIGTIEAGLVAEKLDVAVRQIFLTPTDEALSYLKKDSRVVIGTKDKAYGLYKSYCEDNQIEALFIEGADHSLEIAKQPYTSIKVLGEVMHFIEE